MKSQQFGKRLTVSILLVYCCQQTMAAGMITGSQAENITETHEQFNQTLLMRGEESELNETTTTAATTDKAEMYTTTFAADFEVDGRHAFINNQFVAEDEEPLTHPVLPSYNNLQLSTSNNDHIEVTKPGTQKLSSGPILTQDITGQPDDYEDGETSDYINENDSMPEDSEESEESLLDKEAQTHDDEPTYQQIKPAHSSHYKMQTNANLGGSYYNNNFVQHPNINPGILFASKPATKHGQTESSKKHLQNTTPQQNTFVKPQRTHTQKPNHNMAEQQQKENYNKLQYSLHDQMSVSNSTTETLNLPVPNFSFGNANMQTTSPFSTPSGGHNKRFKTVSSSVQYVSTPLADLVFKYSIGMAKHSHSKAAEHSSHLQGNISKVRNYISGKTE